MSGFTLIEMMVGIAIFAILLALAAPSLSDTVAKNRVEMAADGITGTAATARGLAIQDGRRTTLMVLGTLAECGDKIAWAVVRGTTVLSCLSLKDFSSRFGGIALQGKAFSIEYSPSGIGNNTDMEPVFSLVSASKTIKVRINAGGTTQVL